MAHIRCNMNGGGKKRDIIVAQSTQGGAAAYCDGRYTEENIGYKTITLTASNATYVWVENMNALDFSQMGTGSTARKVGDVIDISDWKYIGIYVMARGENAPGYAKFTLSV